MKDWPKKTHWRKCTLSVCGSRYKVVYSRKLKRFTQWACYNCRLKFVKGNFRILILQKMTPGTYIYSKMGNSVRPPEWFMKKELKEFIPYMVEQLGAELAKEVYMEAFEIYQAALVNRWEHSILSDILSRQQ